MGGYVVLGLLSGVLQIISAIPYFRSILRCETQPNIISQFLWTVLQLIAIVAQLQTGWSWSVLILIATTFNTTVFTILCLKGYGYKEYGWIDYSCFVAAVLALVVWSVTDNPTLVLIITVGTSAFASLPTIAKVFKYPKTEDASAWLIMSAASLLSIFSVSDRSLNNLIAPVQYLIESSIIGWTALLKSLPLSRKKEL
ncbi:MAG: hypothetical protein WAT81_04555 [Candidatus Moraniibacteriota bacterium]